MFKYIITLLTLAAVVPGYIIVQEASEPYDDWITTEIPELSNDCNNETTINSNEKYELLEESYLVDETGSGMQSLDGIEQSEEVTTDDPFEARERLKEEVTTDVKTWLSNLNCAESLMGPFRCVMMKRRISEFYNNPDMDPEVIKPIVINFLKMLHEKKLVDPELEKLINKYKVYVNEVIFE